MRTLALAFLVSLTACSGDDEDTDTSAGSTTNTATNSATSTATTTTTEGTTAGTMVSTTGTDTDGMTSTDGTTDGTTAGTTAGTTTETTTDGTTTVDPTTTTDTTDGTTTTGGGDDPNWPPPDLNNMMMPCPADTAAASFAMGGLICSPECTGLNDACPAAQTGNAVAACVFNPESSGAMCMMGEMCDDPEEMCQMTGGGGMACLKKSDHCVLLCNGGQTCPDGMMCFNNLVCQYPAG